MTSYYDDYYQVTDSGVYYYGNSFSSIDQGRVILDFPLSVGKSWTVYSTGEESRTASVIGDEDVTVPAGTFSCYKVSYISWRGTAEVSSADIWYGDGVGIVKSITMTASTIESVLEWKSF
jgi:hypothetical protein